MLKLKQDPSVVVGLGAVAATAIVASFSTLVGLAHYVGWEGKSGWLLPVCIDALAFAAGRVWLSETATELARSYARKVSLTAIIISILGNALGHIVNMHSASPVKIGLAIVVGSIPPAALAAVGHLATLGIHAPEPDLQGMVEDEVIAALVEPTPEPEPVQEQSNRRGRGRPKTKEPIARAYWDHEREAGRVPTGADLAREAGADPTSGCNWRRAWLAEEEAQKAAMSTGTASFALITA